MIVLGGMSYALFLGVPLFAVNSDAFLNVLREFLGLGMLQNIVAELFGIILTVGLVNWLLKRREEQQERRKWRFTRRGVGSKVGWAHTLLPDKLLETERNGYEVMFQWCKDVLEQIKTVKQQYAYAFTAEMAGHLEEYEEEVNQTASSIQSRQWRNLDTLERLNDVAIDFLKSSDVLANDIEHLYRWSESAIHKIKERLRASDLDLANLPEPSRYIRW